MGERLNKIKESKVYSYIKPVLFIFIMVQTYIWFGKYGILGFLCAVIIIIGIGLIRNRKMYVHILGQAEQVIWGKPLDKKEWDKDEMKNTKVKIKWRRDKNDKSIQSKEVDKEIK